MVGCKDRPKDGKSVGDVAVSALRLRLRIKGNYHRHPRRLSGREINAEKEKYLEQDLTLSFQCGIKANAVDIIDDV